MKTEFFHQNNEMSFSLAVHEKVDLFTKMYKLLVAPSIIRNMKNLLPMIKILLYYMKSLFAPETHVTEIRQAWTISPLDGEIFDTCFISVTRISAPKRFFILYRILFIYVQQLSTLLELRYVLLRHSKHQKFHLPLILP